MLFHGLVSPWSTYEAKSRIKPEDNGKLIGNYNMIQCLGSSPTSLSFLIRFSPIKVLYSVCIHIPLYPYLVPIYMRLVEQPKISKPREAFLAHLHKQNTLNLHFHYPNKTPIYNPNILHSTFHVPFHYP